MLTMIKKLWGTKEKSGNEVHKTDDNPVLEEIRTQDSSETTVIKQVTLKIDPIVQAEPLPLPAHDDHIEPIADNKDLTEAYIPLKKSWKTCYEAVVGLSHRDSNPPKPCQDSGNAKSDPRPFVIIADGAGSSAVSEIGSKTVVTGLSRLFSTIEKQLGQLLDYQQDNKEKIQQTALLIVKHAKGLLEDLSVEHVRPLKDFRCTLLLAIHGSVNTLWVKVGDGAIVVETINEGLLLEKKTIGHAGKGEFSNETIFIDEHIKPSDVQYGVLSSKSITGLAVMSDGAAECLVSTDGRRIANQVSIWFDALRQGTLKRRALTTMFYSEGFTKGKTGDDCSIALASCEIEKNKDVQKRDSND